MDLSSIGFLILLAAMGGGIAYLADMVGKKLGKKRLSVFGLRPRQTAAFGTILLGVLITIFTISFALVVSSPLRQSILHGNQVRQELQDLENTLRSRSNHLAELTQTNDDLSRKIANANKELSVRKAALTTAQGKLTALNSQIGSLQSRIDVLTNDAGRKKMALDHANHLLQDTDHNLQKVRKALAQDQPKLRHLALDNQDMLRQNVKLVEISDNLKATQSRLLAERSQLETDVDKLKKSLSDLQAAEDAATQQLGKARDQLFDAQTELAKTRNALSTTQAQLEKDDQTLQFMNKVSDDSRLQPMIFGMLEEVARVKVPAHLSQNAANGAITLLLRRARVSAQQRGAVRASIVDHKAITSSGIIRDAVKDLTGSDMPKVVIAASSLNAFKGEAVSLELSVFPDPLVYLPGQMVAETVIDANRGDLVIYQQFQNFLQEKVNQHAKKAGMIPIANSDVSFGQISQADVLQVIEQLHAANRPIRLEAHAVGNTYAADPLKLEFRLR